MQSMQTWNMGRYSATRTHQPQGPSLVGSSTERSPGAFTHWAWLGTPASDAVDHSSEWLPPGDLWPSGRWKLTDGSEPGSTTWQNVVCGETQSETPWMDLLGMCLLVHLNKLEWTKKIGIRSPMYHRKKKKLEVQLWHASKFNSATPLPSSLVHVPNNMQKNQQLPHQEWLFWLDHPDYIVTQAATKVITPQLKGPDPDYTTVSQNDPRLSHNHPCHHTTVSRPHRKTKDKKYHPISKYEKMIFPSWLIGFPTTDDHYPSSMVVPSSITP